MRFISPMLASPMPKKNWSLTPGRYVAEEKYDGHRLVVAVSGPHVTAWSRYGLSRVLPQAMINQLSFLADGTYDGELIVPGAQSTSVTELTRQGDLEFVLFDVMRVADTEAIHHSYRDRRQVLEAIFREWTAMKNNMLPHEPRLMQLSTVSKVNDMTDVDILVESVWDRGGEGLILKDVNSKYSPGKRPKGEWIKIKELKSTTIKIIGFTQGLNGPYARVVGVDKDGTRVTVKTKNNAELARCAKDPQAVIGRILRIEYQSPTENEKYRHPRWDRFEDE